MVDKEKYLGEAQMKAKPTKKLKLIIEDEAVKTRHIDSKAVVTEKIADEAITNEKLKDGLISWAKLDDNVKNIIASREEGGIALANELGNSKMIGISQWKLTEELNAINNKTDNIADEEDLTMVSVDERPAIQLRDKAYEPEKHSGLGRKYLRKNVTYDVEIVHFGGFVENVAIEPIGVAITDGNSSNVVYDRIRKAFLYREQKDSLTPAKYYDTWTSEEVPYSDYYQSSFTTSYTIRTDVVFMLGDVPYRWDENDQELAVWGDFYEAHSKNILTQAMINEPNTIYHIQYDYDLNGQTITVPEGCTLEFEGGSLRNGSLDGDFIIKGIGKGFINIEFIKHHKIESHLLGIMPDIDCTENFVYYTRQPLSIVFGPKAYFISLNNNTLAKGCSLIGADSSRNTVLNILPNGTPNYLIGINYFSSIKDMKIQVRGKNQLGIDILRIDNAFGRQDTSYGSWYQYYIDNVNIEGVYIQGNDYSNGDTAISIKTNEFADDGTKPTSTALSYKNHLNNVSIRFFKCGIRLENKREADSSSSVDTYWQNSLLITDITISALIGIYFDRENVGNSSASIIILNYVFQSYDSESSFGLYGRCSRDMVSNYVSWDSKYLGCIWGSIYANNTAMLTSGIFQAVDYSETTNGFKVPNGKTLYLNIIPNGITRYMPDNYSDSLRTHIIDYRNQNSRKWTVANESANAGSIFLEEGVTDIKGRNITFINKYHYLTDCFITKRIYNNYLPEVQYWGYNASTGDTTLLGNFAYPTLNKTGLSVFKEPYNFRKAVQYIDLSNYISKSGTAKIQINANNGQSGNTSSGFIVSSIAANYGTIVKVEKGNEATRIPIINVYIHLKVLSSLLLYLSIDYKLTSFTYNTADEPPATTVIPTFTVLSFIEDALTSGTFANKPTVSNNNIEVGFKYFCTDKQTAEGQSNGIEIIHKGNDVWVDALGRVVS